MTIRVMPIELPREVRSYQRQSLISSLHGYKGSISLYCKKSKAAHESNEQDDWKHYYLQSIHEVSEALAVLRFAQYSSIINPKWFNILCNLILEHHTKEKSK